MFSSYPRAYPRPAYRYGQHFEQLQNPGPDELEALADDLEYRAARARQASIASANWGPYPPYRYTRPQLQSARSYVQPRPRQQLEYVVEVEDDEFGDFEYTSPYAHQSRQAPRRRAIQHTPRRTVSFADLEPVLEEVEFASAEQRRREVRDAQVLAAAQRARARAQAQAEAEAEARRVREVEARLARERQRQLKEKQEREREQERRRIAIEAQVAAARQEQESVEDVLALLFGHTARTGNANGPIQKRTELPPATANANANANAGQFASVEDFLGQILGVSSASPISMNASTFNGNGNGTQPRQPIANIIHNAGFRSAARPQIKNAPQTQAVNPAQKPSPSLPVPGRRTFSHLSPNPHDVGLTAQQQGQQSQTRAGADEVADLLEAIRRSLDPRHNATAGSSSASSSTHTALGSSPSASTSASTAVRPTAAPAKPSDPISIIGTIEARFVNLTYDFTFPTSPDFPISHPTTSAFTPALLFTSTNQPIRAHEHALTSLLTELDAIESAGDAEVRRVRKELVTRIEGALEGLEGMKAAAWKRVSEAQAIAAPAATEQTEQKKPETDRDAKAVVEVEAEGYVIAEAEPEPEPEEESAPVVVEPTEAEAEAIVQTDDGSSSLAQNLAAVAQSEEGHDLPVAAEKTDVEVEAEESLAA